MTHTFASPLESIVTLQRTVDEIAELDDMLENFPPSMREVAEKYSAAKSEMDALQEQIDEAVAIQRQAEADVQDWKVKVDHLQGQTREVRTQREYGAILKEVDHAKEELQGAEQRGAEATATIESAEQEISSRSDDYSSLSEEFAELEQAWEKERPNVEERRRTAAQLLEEMRTVLPVAVRSRVERILTYTQGQAMTRVVPVDRKSGANLWACSTCAYRIRPQAVVELRTQGLLLQCEGCKRFLYIDDPEEEE